ncbi:predicted protein [Sclerotinia sclerotiorum 1980 UF-70]|uniref:Prokaryotic-type class I peptide chain release factors domain-containing protein n=1 Tax=Sclerotinia sclerotiorum (strain ATCC 18683 / 1980 / Ss-1) TaxID=665079 RepID=A7F3N2_SCLS1|nr:predicted protein [Sclerotinia sclerotiorum 1980 UF-70]EDN97353.1 predicted protein [Sclerotinia sclerotiorum 1980 UF-70]
MRYSSTFLKLTSKLLQSSGHVAKPIYTSPFRARFLLLNLDLRSYKFYSVQSTDEAESEIARKWYSEFNNSTIPRKIAKTHYTAAGGPGGQKTNKTASKANTVWSMKDLDAILPSIISKGLRRGTHYVKNTDAIQIQCDSSRNRTDNQEETHRRLHEEIKSIYNTTVPGKASIEQQQRVKNLTRLLQEGFEKLSQAKHMSDKEIKTQTSANLARLRMKKQHGDKKKSRSGGKGGGDY